jgi:hypothetical protein
MEIFTRAIPGRINILIACNCKHGAGIIIIIIIITSFWGEIITTLSPSSSLSTLHLSDITSKVSRHCHVCNANIIHV